MSFCILIPGKCLCCSRHRSPHEIHVGALKTIIKSLPIEISKDSPSREFCRMSRSAILGNPTKSNLVGSNTTSSLDIRSLTTDYLHQGSLIRRPIKIVICVYRNPKCLCPCKELFVPRRSQEERGLLSSYI